METTWLCTVLIFECETRKFDSEHQDWQGNFISAREQNYSVQIPISQHINQTVGEIIIWSPAEFEFAQVERREQSLIFMEVSF